MARFVALIMLVGCGGRDLSVVEGDHYVPYVPPEDTAADDTGFVDDTPSIDPIEALACTDVATEPQDLALTWCKRISPELDQVLPTDPRCGFFNSVGALALTNETAPVATYCDADIDAGGVHVVRYDPDDGTLTSNLASGQTCIAIPDSGAVVPVGDAYVALWAEYDVSSDSWSGILRAAQVGADGVIGDALAPTDVPGDAYAIEVAGRLALATNSDDALYTAVLDASGLPGTFTHVADGVRDFEAVAVGTGAAAVSCVDGALKAWGFDASGHATWTRTVDGVACRDLWDPPAIVAGADGRVAISWTDSDSHDGLIRFTPGGVAQTMALPAPVGEDYGSMAPRLLVDGDAWYAVTRRGEVLRLEEDGSTTLLGVHPAIRAHGDDLREVRLSLRDGQMTFGLLWSQMLTVGPHIYGFQVLELSSAPLPAP